MKKEITFKELKNSDYKNKTINQEIQSNLIARIKAKQTVFEGLFGYEDTVIPQLKKAIIAWDIHIFNKTNYYKCF